DLPRVKMAMASELFQKLNQRMCAVEGRALENPATPERELQVESSEQGSAGRRLRKSIGSDFLTTIAERRARVDGNAKTFENSPSIKVSDVVYGELPPSPVRGRRSLGAATSPSPGKGRLSLTSPRIDNSWIGAELQESGSKEMQPMPVVAANRVSWTASLARSGPRRGRVIDSPEFKVACCPGPVFLRLVFGDDERRCRLSLHGTRPSDCEVRVVFFAGDKWQTGEKGRPSTWQEGETPGAEFAVSDMAEVSSVFFCGLIHHSPLISAA
ncbi:unnamed protein product, partial [Polarella glacialis]